MTVELSGFQTYIEEGIEIRVGLTVTRNIKISIKKMEEEVTVVGRLRSSMSRHLRPSRSIKLI
jgi:hypothetical protein